MKKYTLLLLICISKFVLYAQAPQYSQVLPPLPESQLKNVLHYISNGDSEHGDLDGDGDLDLIIMGEAVSGKMVALYLNDGDGNFIYQTGTPFIGVDEGFISLGDTDGDLDLDIIISGETSSGAASTKLYQNNGNAVFTVVAGTPFENVKQSDGSFFDYDNDSDLDLILTGLNSSSVYVTKLYRNIGGGFLLNSTNTFLAGSICKILVGNVDFDTDEDLIIYQVNAFPTMTANLYKNNGLGAFTASALPFNFEDYDDICLQDMDNDNYPDVLVIGLSSGIYSNKIYKNQNGLSFTYINSNNVTNLAAANAEFHDLDNDGDSDYLLTGWITTGGAINKVYLNNGINSFLETTNPQLIGTYQGSTNLFDIDGDLDKDAIIIGFSNTNSEEIYVNNGSALFSRVRTSPFPGSYNGETVFFDIDGDTDEDIVTIGGSESSSMSNGVYLNDGFGEFEPFLNHGLPVFAKSNMEVADLDNDGDLDIICMGQSDFIPNVNNNVTQVFLNDGLGFFSALPNAIPKIIVEGGIAVGDIDNDGDLDLALTGTDQTTPGSPVKYSNVLFNNGSGIFTESSNIFGLLSHGDAEFSDLDGDGDLDLLYCGNQAFMDQRCKLYINNGTGIYSVVASTPFTGVEYSSITMADVDGDFDNDVLISGFYNYSPYKICNLYQNNGGNNFTLWPGQPFLPSYQGEQVMEDVDGDGDIDILVSGETSNTIFGAPGTNLYLNNGAGTFTIYPTIFDNVMRSSHKFSDVDGDGDKDVFLNGYNDRGKIISKLYINETCGAVTAEEQLTINTCGEYITPGGMVLTSSGTYLETAMNEYGCLIDYTINLTLQELTYVQTINECTSYLSPEGNIYTITGTYYDTIPSLYSCDSVIITYLTIQTSNNTTETVVTCDNYFWPTNSQTYIASGTYQHVLVNSSGCDSIVSIELTINQNSSDQITVNGIDLVVVNGETFTQNGTYIQNLTNSEGCDSTLTISVDLDFTGLDELNQDFSIYPNPTSNKVRISTKYSSTYNLTILDLQGKKLLYFNNAEGIIELNVEHLPSGIYMLNISQDNEFVMKKLIINK